MKTGTDRIILHCDCNAFFASVESIDHPEYREVPMAVCGNPANRHGIILAKNEKAKAFGIKTAETIWQAQKKCPELLLINASHGQYDYYSKKINKIYREYTDYVQPFGIDESWLDVSENADMFGGGVKLADEIRERIKKEFSLTISVGVSFNKIFAKLGSDYKKPDATTYIGRENFKSIVYPLPVSELLFAGKHTTDALSKYGFKTIGDVAKADVSVLTKILGKAGKMLYEYASGNDNSPVMKYDYSTQAKSVGNGLTFASDLTDIADIKAAIFMLSETVSKRMKKECVRCTCVQVTVRSNDFVTFTRQRKTSHAIYSAAELSEYAYEIISSELKAVKEIRMITITAQNLVPLSYETQLDLFDSEDKGIDYSHKNEQLEEAINKIREKHGADSIMKGILWNHNV